MGTPVEMTILLWIRPRFSPGEAQDLVCNRIVIPTGTQRSGERPAVSFLRFKSLMKKNVGKLSFDGYVE
jgi:hypothetical protein